MIQEKFVKIRNSINYEESVKLIKAHVERSKSVLICSYSEQLDDDLCEIQMICTRDHATMTTMRKGIMNQQYFCKGFTYIGLYNAEEIQIGMKIETEDYSFVDNVVNIVYKVYFNDSLMGDYEFKMEIGES